MLKGKSLNKATQLPTIQEEKFLSLTVYENQTRSILETPQPFPGAVSQSYSRTASVEDTNRSTIAYLIFYHAHKHCE
jgi:hypothetical protein